MDAQRNLLIQNLGLTWRYSVGNPYQQFSFPEAVDVAQVLSGWGFARVARSILETSMNRRPRPYPNWKAGQRLVGSALHWRLFRDRAYIDRVDPGARPLCRRSRAADHGEPSRPARTRALLLRHSRLGVRPPLTGGRVAGPARDGPRLAADGTATAGRAERTAGGEARGRAAAGSPAVAGAAARRVALSARAAAGRRAALRPADARRGPAATGTWSRRTRSRPGSSRAAGRRRRAGSRYMLATGHGCSGSSAPPPSRSTGRRPATRSPGPTRSTASTSHGSWR